MPTLELTTLGTGSPIHQPHRFGNSQVISGGGTNVLVDVGWGATVRLYQAGITPQKIDAVFVTHLHSDHTTDFADFLVMRWVGGITKPLRVYGPEGTDRMIAGYRQALEADTRFRFAHHGEQLNPVGTECDVTEISVGGEPKEIAKVGDITVKAFEVDHRPVMPAYGFRLEREGKSIVISGDTNACPGLLNGSQGADILVGDSMNKNMMVAVEERLRAIGNSLQAGLLNDAHNYHTDVKDVAEIAEKAGVKHLVLSHLIPSIVDEQIPEFTAGLDAIYSGKISVASDLATFAVS
ncbi:MAG: MBL fold metallo-hydrolase [Dehalococcoidia bacterium]